MDETDFLICKTLMRNSRMTFRNLADMTNMSVSGIHKRIKKLVDNGDILEFVAIPSMISLKFLMVIIFGTSSAESRLNVVKELIQHENIYTVNRAGGKFLYINSFIRDITELQDFTSYVSKTAHINDPTVGILNKYYLTTPEPLTKMDYKILRTMNVDARKPIADIAEEVGLSAKTVKKRLDRMIENKLVTFSIRWGAQSENNLLTYCCYIRDPLYPITFGQPTQTPSL